MNLSPQQRKQLREALMDAFLSKKKLEIVLKEELDKDLDAIVGGADLGEITFELIKLANSEGWVEDLIRAARQSNPGNSLLRAIAQELLTFHETSSSNIDTTDSTQQIKLQTNSQTISQKTGTKILHLVLKPISSDYAEFRYFWDDTNDSQPCQLPLSEINELIQDAERDYYTIRPEDYAKTGQALYNWLDGSERIFQRAINQHRRDGIVLAIAATDGLAHLPWEVLHDGQRFLVERAIIPVRCFNFERCPGTAIIFHY